MQTCILNGIILTACQKEAFLAHGYIRIHHGIIQEIAPMDKYVAQPDEEIVDAKNGIVMPGMINTHTHLPMIPFRGLGDDTFDRLRKFLIPMEKKYVNRELVYFAARYGIAEELLSGVTSVVDMYYFEEEVMRAAKELGIRGHFGETLMEEATPSYNHPKEALQAIKKMLPLQDERVKVCIAPHGTSTCSEETLRFAKELARKESLLFTTHAAEMDYEMKYFAEKYQQSPIVFLAQQDLLDENTLLAHCIHLDDHDRDLLYNHHANIAHCIGANTKAAKGVPQITEAVDKGIVVGLGTDGPASGNTLDIITQLKLFANFHKMATHDRTKWPCQDIIHLATLSGAKCLHQEKNIGSLEIGKQADIVIIETDSVNMFPVYDPYSALVYSASAHNVRDVMVAGEWLVKNRKLLRASLPEIRQSLMDALAHTTFHPL